jgi:hypothetical protein
MEASVEHTVSSVATVCTSTIATGMITTIDTTGRVLAFTGPALALILVGEI